MALDQIWKQQLTLVTYGNEYLEGNLNFSRWVEHPIFNQNRLIFRDLLSQHLLAQQFASYGVMINQMESSFSGLKMLILQSQASR
jgi:hypothetical protein